MNSIKSAAEKISSLHEGFLRLSTQSGRFSREVSCRSCCPIFLPRRSPPPSPFPRLPLPRCRPTRIHTQPHRSLLQSLASCLTTSRLRCSSVWSELLAHPDETAICAVFMGHLRERWPIFFASSFNAAGSPKINLQNLSHFLSLICCHFQPANHHNFTTFLPSFAPQNAATIPKIPRKNRNPPQKQIRSLNVAKNEAAPKKRIPANSHLRHTACRVRKHFSAFATIFALDSRRLPKVCNAWMIPTVK